MVTYSLRPELLFDGRDFRPKGAVLILRSDGTILDILDQATTLEDIIELKGLLTPGFVNCHCHLELSHLRGAIPRATGIVGFIQAIFQHRNAEATVVHKAIDAADAYMLNNGIVAVGDICNGDLTLKKKQTSPLLYHNFLEVAGFPPMVAEPRMNAILELSRRFADGVPGMPVSIVPHAPYSVSATLFQLIRQHNSGNSSCIHNQESEAENRFFKDGSGPFRNLFNGMGIDIDEFFSPPGTTSLQYVLPMLDGSGKWIFVHNTFTGHQDVRAIAESFIAENSFFCLCPNANLYIESKLPDVPMLIENGANIVIGTDSLASNDRLDLVSEIGTLCDHFPNIKPEIWWRAATSTGARALGMDNELGSFEYGKKPGLTQIAVIGPNGKPMPNSNANRLDLACYDANRLGFEKNTTGG